MRDLQISPNLHDCFSTKWSSGLDDLGFTVENLHLLSNRNGDSMGCGDRTIDI